MIETAHLVLLKGVSRSFYLSLRLLPGPMQGAASLAYLLARTSDTLADAETLPSHVRLSALEAFSQAVKRSEAAPEWPSSLVASLIDSREQSLLMASRRLFAWLDSLSDAEAALVRQVISVITSGQELDLRRFSLADADHPIALACEAELEDYTWRVAGCVGEFWTRLGYLTLGDGFSRSREDVLISRGISYGKGLQLINILRDLPADLSAGRCYLPLANVADRSEIAACRAHWSRRAESWIGEGFAYSSSLVPRRLRAASVLPAMLAKETLMRLEAAGPLAMQARIKVPRHRVYLALVQAFWSKPCAR
jgi:farnesyl-diphosphate farnesyltransferase